MNPIRVVALSVLSLIGISSATAAWADGPLQFVQYAPGGLYRASNIETSRREIAQFSLFCYEEGDPAILIDCNEDFKVLGLADVLQDLGFQPSGYPEMLIEGGHMEPEHANALLRPFEYTGGGPYLTAYNGTFITDTTSPLVKPLELNFDTGTTTHPYVQYPIPEEAGLIAVKVETTFKFPWFCADFCVDPGHATTIFELQVGAFQPGFAQTALYKLPPQGDDYVILLTGPSTGHQDLTAGSSNEDRTLGDYLDPNVMPWFDALAGLYHNDHGTGHRLSVNDASLPLGGRFDLNDDWDFPHHGHRDGWAIDLNKAGEGEPSIDCDDDDLLQDEVWDAMASVDPDDLDWEALHCEPENHENKHLNLRSPLQ